MATSTSRRRRRPAPDLTPQVASFPRVVEGEIVRVSHGLAEVVTHTGEHLLARCPQHIDPEWLCAAVAIAPVEAIITCADGGRPFVWCIFPAVTHAAVRLPVTIRGTEIRIEASEDVKLTAGRSSLSLDREGEVRLRGRDVTSRASQVNRVMGGRVKLN
jgi:hypothetical protein